MRKIKQTVSKRSHEMFIFLVEEVGMFRYIIFFALAVIIFGIVYTLLTPISHGIGQNSTPLFEVSNVVTFLNGIPNGIYFSVVTISSLGYGDMHPMGFSKVLICMEVLLGLALIGIMIAKVTSRRLSYHVSRLFSFDAQKRLEDIAAKFDAFQNDLDKIMPLLVAAYQSAPGQTTPPTEDRGVLISDFRNVISDLRVQCVELRKYLSAEIEQDNNYFQIAPASAMMRVGEALDEAFFILSQHITSLPTQARTEILDGHNRQGISEAINSQKQVCDLVDKHATDSNTQAVFQRIGETCDQVPVSYFVVPEESQPNQLLQGTDEPQQPSDQDNEHTDSL